MSQLHASDSVFCHRHRWKVGLLDLVDELWMTDALPDDELSLPEGLQLGADEAEARAPVAEERPEERWSEPPLAQLLEDEAEPGAGG
mmetsp:Transcript_108200/g.290520  ORF Transcript_108200/g.290520 Transcript_108200/m.290520 type:complete len:87 (-) Transcript_108200:111-371(-)